MWQRIQTLYLALATGLVVALLFSTMAVAYGTDGQTAQIAYVEKIPYLYLLISILLANACALVTFKHRVLQMRISTIAALLLLGLQICIAVDYFRADDGIVFKFTAVFPLIAAILDILAVKGIASDILVAESVNHLRTSRKNRKK